MRGLHWMVCKEGSGRNCIIMHRQKQSLFYFLLILSSHAPSKIQEQ